ncbi:hypothetical protein QTP86_018328 [Hemibagrus guttatus]|nr:hypothetical protein QTP86_018328 [Hemibagrus guttatus]
MYGRTEMIDNTLNPDFVRKFVLDFFFEEKQNLRFDVYNVDTRSSNISKHVSSFLLALLFSFVLNQYLSNESCDFLGQTFCTLGEIIGSTGSRMERTLSGIPGKKCGTIILNAEELSNCRDIATMQLCANKLDKKDFFGKSDPFLVFYRSNEDGTFTICHKTEVIKNTLNPVWQPFTIPVRALCNGDYDRVLESEKMPEEWRRSVLVPIFKNKGDVQSCSNYRGIKLMSHTMKLWERVVEAKLRKVVEICEQQYGFMPRKSTTDAIFALRILMEKYRDGQRELHCVFVDLEKAYDRVPREELWYCMRKSGVAEKYVRVVQDMYERSRTVVKCAVGQTEEFKVEVGLHQGSALSPFLFAIVMGQLSEEVRQESPWTMMFVDDIVICSESREQVEENLEKWRIALERRGMKLIGEEVKKVQEFKYLWSTVQSNGECGKEVKKTVKVDVYDWDRDGSHDFIGEFTTSYRELSRGQSQFNVYEVLNPKKKGKKKKYVNSGTVTLLSFKVESEYTFVDFIRGGTQLNFTVAIDFTASNGNPAQPTSLHYMSPYQMNAYAMALKAVGEIIQDYDSDKLFPAYGFGAKLPPDGKISHAFPLNGNNESPNCVGIEEVLEAYFQSLRKVQLYGPTNFAPVINQVARAAQDVTDGSQYFVLLMITDGVISDMVQTKEAVVNASALPMSIIIVGVGPAEFDAMEELDGDEVRVSSRGRFAERDIVQFVPFRDYIDRSGNQILSMARLAKDVLAEIPDQLLSFMKSKEIKPRPAPPASSMPNKPSVNMRI